MILRTPILRNPGRTDRKRSRGAVLVEAAISLPIVLLVLFAVIEFGLYFQSFFAGRNAVREASRLVTTFRADCNEAALQSEVDALVDELLEILPASHVTGPSVSYPRGASNLCGDDPQGLVAVTVSFDHRMPVLSSLLATALDPFPATLPVTVTDVRRDFNE